MFGGSVDSVRFLKTTLFKNRIQDVTGVHFWITTSGFSSEEFSDETQRTGMFGGSVDSVRFLKTTLFKNRIQNVTGVHFWITTYVHWCTEERCNPQGGPGLVCQVCVGSVRHKQRRSPT